MIMGDIEIFFGDLISPFVCQMKTYLFSLMIQSRAKGLLGLDLFIRNTIFFPFFLLSYRFRNIGPFPARSSRRSTISARNPTRRKSFLHCYYHFCFRCFHYGLRLHPAGYSTRKTEKVCVLYKFPGAYCPGQNIHRSGCSPCLPEVLTLRRQLFVPP